MDKCKRISVICIALLCITVTGCDAPDSTSDTAALQAELEQMENQIGRLEFRVFELEQRLGDYTGAAASPTADQPATAAPADQGRYDLTPVE